MHSGTVLSAIGQDDSLVVPPGATRELDVDNNDSGGVTIRVIAVAGVDYSLELTIADNR